MPAPPSLVLLVSLLCRTLGCDTASGESGLNLRKQFCFFSPGRDLEMPLYMVFYVIIPSAPMPAILLYFFQLWEAEI